MYKLSTTVMLWHMTFHAGIYYQSSNNFNVFFGKGLVFISKFDRTHKFISAEVRCAKTLKFQNEFLTCLLEWLETRYFG